MKIKIALLSIALFSSISAQAWINCESGPTSKGIVRVSFGVDDNGYSLDYMTSQYSVFGSTGGGVSVESRDITRINPALPLNYNNIKSVKGRGYTWGSNFTATLNIEKKTFSIEYDKDGQKAEEGNLICDLDRGGI